MEIKYHLDESVNNAIANGLRLRGIDVTTSKAAGLVGATDPEQLHYANREGRVLVTHDDDMNASRAFRDSLIDRFGSKHVMREFGSL